MHHYGLIRTWKTAKGMQMTSSFLKEFPSSEGFEDFLVEKQVPSPACFPWVTGQFEEVTQ